MHIKTALQIVHWMIIQLSAGAAKASKVMRDGALLSYVKTTTPDERQKMKKKGSLKVKEALKEEEYCI